VLRRTTDNNTRQLLSKRRQDNLLTDTHTD